MTTQVVTVHPETTVKEVARLLGEHRISAVPVLDQDKTLVGVVSEADLLRKEADQDGPGRLPLTIRSRRAVHEARAKADAETAGELMTSPAIGIAPDASVVDAARLMERHSVKRLPVVDGAGRLRGIVSRGDLLRVFLRTDERIRGEILEDLLRRDLWVDPESITVHVHDGVVELTGEMEHKTLARILVRMCRGVDGVVRVHDHLTWALDDTKVHPTELPQLHGRGGWGRD
ncbi:MAG: CBS domain-containing protein [Streptomycetaceae bacterium]|nr:CBS domain-containing protein [Streptomycetaceae bacterium]